MDGVNVPVLGKCERVALALLCARREEYGLGLVDASGGALPLGSVYQTLAKLGRFGFVKYRVVQVQSGPPRHMYSLTDSGHAAHAALVSLEQCVDSGCAQ